MLEEISMKDIMENVFMKKTKEMGYDDFNTDKATIYFQVKESQCLMMEKNDLHRTVLWLRFRFVSNWMQICSGGDAWSKECPDSGWDGVLLNDCETACQVLGNLGTVLKYPTVSFGCISLDYSNIKRLK